MREIDFLSRKEARQMLSYVEKQWDADLSKWLDEYVLAMNKGNLYLVSRSVANLGISKLRINSLGLYVAEFIGTEPRLSIEGSQLVGPLAKLNVIELSQEQAMQWIKGNPVEFKCDSQGFVIIKHGSDFMGSGKCKQGLIFNYVPKARRLQQA